MRLREVIRQWVAEVPREDLLEAILLFDGAAEDAVAHSRSCLEGYMQAWLGERGRPVDRAALCAAWLAAKVWWREEIR